MLSTNQAYLDDIYTKSNEKRFLPDFTVGGTLKLNDTNIQEFQFQELSTSEEGPGIGSFPLRKLTVKVYATDTSLYRDKVLKADIRHVSGAVFPLGTYKVSEVKKNNKVLVLTCYDSAEKLNFGYFPKINFPAGANVVLSDISLQSGVSVQPLTTDFTITEKLDGYTYREALGIIAGYGGLFARTDRYGKVVLKDYTETGRKIPASGYKSLEQSENPVKIEQLLSNGFVSGSAGYSLKFDNPLITQAQLDKIFAVKKAWSFYSGTLSASGDPSLETGDVIEAVTREGNPVKLFVMDLTLSYSGALSMVVKSKAKDEARNNSENNKLSLRESVQLQQIQLAIINRALVNKLEAKDLTAVNADIQSLKADKADVGTLNAKIAEVNNLIAKKADIIQLNAVNADITDLKAQVGSIDALVAKKADIIQLEAVNADISTLKASNASIDNLLAGNITAANLKAGLITADSGLIAHGAIKDAMILDLSANKISAGTIFTNKVSIQNQDGSLSLTGSLLRMWDDRNRERISLGKDPTGNFTIKVRGTDGQTIMIDETGVRNAGITDGAINDAKVAANANIQGTKLDIKSVIQSINADGSTSLKSSKILFDDTGQTLSVAFNQLNNYVKNISVGARNYFKRSDKPISLLKKTVVTTDPETPNGFVLTPTADGEEDTIRIPKVITEAGEWTVSFIAWGELDSNVFSTDINDTGPKYITVTKTKKKFSNTVAVSYVNDTYNFVDFGILKDSLSGKIYIDDLQIEKGNKPTDWSPAPEDYSKNFQDIDKKITNLNTNLGVEQGRINTLISEQTLIKGATDSNSNKLTTLEQDVDGFKKTVANTYETINGASGKYSTKSELSTLHQSVESFKLNVSSTYATKTDLGNLKIGGRNLLKGTSDDWKEVDLTTSNWYFQQGSDHQLEIGETYTFSIIVEKVSQDTVPINLAFGGGLTADQFTFDLNEGPNVWGLYPIPFGVKISRTRTITEVDLKDGNGNFHKFFAFRLRNEKLATKIRYKKVKLEKGNKPTDWTPAPEDINLSIATVATKSANLELALSQFKTEVSSKYETVDHATNTYTTQTKHGELVQSLDAFKATVSQTYATNSALGSYALASTVSTLQQDMTGFKSTLDNTVLKKDSAGNSYIAEQILAQLSLTSSAITMKLSESYVKPDALTGLAKTSDLSAYTKSSELKTTLDDLSFKLSRTSSLNLIINGDFSNGLIMWSSNATPSTSDENGIQVPILSPGITLKQPLKGIDPNAGALTLSGFVKMNALTATAKACAVAYIWFKDGTTTRLEHAYSDGQTRTAAWTRFTVTRENLKPIDRITIFIENPSANTGTIQFKDVQLQYGPTATGYQKSGGEFTATNYIFDGQSAKFYGAGLEIYDKVGSTNKIFGVNTAGILDLKGEITTYDSTGKRVAYLGKNALTLYEFATSTNNAIGGITVRAWNGQRNTVHLGAEGSYGISIGKAVAGTIPVGGYPPINFDDNYMTFNNLSSDGSFAAYPVNIFKSTNLQGNLKVKSASGGNILMDSGNNIIEIQSGSIELRMAVGVRLTLYRDRIVASQGSTTKQLFP